MGEIYIKDTLATRLASTAHHVGTSVTLTSSVMILDTHALPVSGKAHCFTILGLPCLSVCSIVTTTLVAEGLLTRSMAPPKPLTLPGSIQLARSPVALTCMAPSIVRLMRPLRI